jgi:hypothetical protein
LQLLLERQTADGPVDVVKLIRLAATLRVSTVPLRHVPTLRFGVQILVDGGDGMAPFAADQDHVVRQVRDLVGAERTEVRYFANAPLRGVGYGPVWTWTDYRPPAPGTPVLVLSDIGLGGWWLDPARAERSEWEEFARVIVGHGCELIALVPYPAARWPAWLTRRFAVATWDRRLTAGRAQRTRS